MLDQQQVFRGKSRMQWNAAVLRQMSQKLCNIRLSGLNGSAAIVVPGKQQDTVKDVRNLCAENTTAASRHSLVRDHVCDVCNVLQGKCDMTFAKNVCEYCQEYVWLNKTINNDVCHIDRTNI